MNKEFEIRLVTNHTTSEMYASTSASSELVRIPTDAGVEFLLGGSGLKIPVANTAAEFSSQSFATICLRDPQAAAAVQWAAWSYYFKESSSGAGSAQMTNYELYQIQITDADIPDGTDMTAHYAAGVHIGTFSKLSNSEMLHLPGEFGVRGLMEDINGIETQRLGIWIIGDISTGITK